MSENNDRAAELRARRKLAVAYLLRCIADDLEREPDCTEDVLERYKQRLTEFILEFFPPAPPHQVHSPEVRAMFSQDHLTDEELIARVREFDEQGGGIEFGEVLRALKENSSALNGHQATSPLDRQEAHERANR